MFAEAVGTHAVNANICLNFISQEATAHNISHSTQHQPQHTPSISITFINLYVVFSLVTKYTLLQPALKSDGNCGKHVTSATAHSCNKR